MPRRFSIALLALWLCALCTAPCWAHGFIEHVTPPVWQRGKTTRVTFYGSQLDQAVDLWSCLATGKIKATPVRVPGLFPTNFHQLAYVGVLTPFSTPPFTTLAGVTVFDVKVADDAPVGLCGIRVATIHGLSNTHLLLIDDLPVHVRPPALADKVNVQLPVAVWGTFREAEVDRYTIEVMAGQRVSFEVVANRFGKEVDPLITLRDPQGKFVLERDNDPGLYFDCRFEHVFPAAGTYTVEVRDARFHGADNGHYVLRMGRFPAARVALPNAVQPGQRVELRLPELGGEAVEIDVPADQPAGPFFVAVRRPDDDGSTWLPVTATRFPTTVELEPNNTIEQATRAPAPGVLCGVLGEPGDRDYFLLELSRGQKVNVRGVAKALNSPVDLELILTDATGREIGRGQDGGQEDVVLNFTAGVAGAYGLLVRDLARDGGPAFVYRLDVRTSQPRLIVNAEVEGLTVPQGSYQALPLTIVRTEYTGPIELTLVGAPPGMTLTPSEIPEKVEAIVCQLSAPAATPTGLSTFHILAQPTQVRPVVPGSFVRTRPLIDRKLKNVDLIPYALREDQLRVPPALTDRFALQVTPPAPFTLELPDKLLTLPRYQTAELPIATTRVPGFDGPISFHVEGGPIGAKKEFRAQVYAELPSGMPAQLTPRGVFFTRNLVGVAKSRITLTGSGTHQGREVTLLRCFELDVKPAFNLEFEPAKVTLLPGGAARVRLLANRLPSFDGDIQVQLTPVQGLTLPPNLLIPHGQPFVDLDVTAAPETTPNNYGVTWSATALVNKFEQDQRVSFTVEVKKPEVVKKPEAAKK